MMRMKEVKVRLFKLPRITIIKPSKSIRFTVLCSIEQPISYSQESKIYIY